MPVDLSNPPFLYRYRPLTEDPLEPGRDVVQDEIELIRNGFIWLSHPKNLNDPFDCRPICSSEQKPRLDRLLDKFLVGSLSAIPPDDLEASPMWSYYADNHRGICIEFPFDRKRSDLRTPIERVRYSNARFDVRGLDPEKMRITSPVRIGVPVPSDEFSDPANNIDILELTRKSEAWRHEAEWRYIWPQNYTQSAEMLARERAVHGSKAEHKALVCRPSRVILGAHMDGAKRRRVTDLLKENGIPIADAHLSETEYRLTLVSFSAADDPK